MYWDVHAHCRGCLTCASYQGTGRRVKLQLMSIPWGGGGGGGGGTVPQGGSGYYGVAPD